MTIGTNYRSGSAIVATTGTGSGRDMDSAIVAIHENIKTGDQVTGQRHQQETDSAYKAIGMIRTIRDMKKNLKKQRNVEPQECHGRHSDSTKKNALPEGSLNEDGNAGVRGIPRSAQEPNGLNKRTESPVLPAERSAAQE
jgi:hypothetical protein